MTATAKFNQSAEAQSPGKSSPSTSYAKRGENVLSADSQPFSAPKQAARQEKPDDRNSERAYIASLRRSITQMRNGDVQPVREGLEELRRELDADVEGNPVDK